MASTDARPVPQKNVAYRVTFPILDADGDLVTGASTPDSEVSKDGGTFADCTNEITEIATSSGMYFLDLTSTEMNADTVAIIVKTATAGAKTVPIVLYPEEAGDIRVNLTQILGTAVSTPATAGILDVNVKNIDNDAASASGTVTFPNATLASTTNITAGTVTTATNVTTVNGLAASVITAASIAADAITAAKVADGTIDAATFAAGAINAAAIAADAITAAKIADGAIDAATFAAGAINAAAIAADAIGASELAADAVAEIADAVWDEAIAGHLGAGTTGLALNSAGSAGDPWSTALPGAYAAGTAGKIVGDNVDAAISSRAAQTSINDMPTNAELATALGTADDAVLAAISALNNLSQANIRTAIGLASANLDTQLDAVPTAIENADALLDRNMATGTDSGSPTVRTPRQALRFSRNKWSMSGSTLTVTKEDDATASWTSTVTATVGADPITASDPAGP